MQAQLGSSDYEHLKEALENLGVMLQVLNCFEGTQSHLIVDYQEHLRRIFDLVMGSTCFEVFQMVLSQPELTSDLTVPYLKMEVLKSLVYMTIGSKYLASPRGLQSNYSR